MKLSQDSFSNSCTQTHTITARNSQRKESTTRDIFISAVAKNKNKKKNAPQRHVERVHNFLIAVKRTENLLLISSFPYIAVHIMSQLISSWAISRTRPADRNFDGKEWIRWSLRLPVENVVHNPTERHVNTNTQWCVLDLRYYSAIYMKRIRTGRWWFMCIGLDLAILHDPLVAVLWPFYFFPITFLRLFCVVRDTTNSFSPFYFLIFGSGENWMKRRRSMSTISWGFLRWGLWSSEDLIRPVSLLSTFEK